MTILKYIFTCHSFKKEKTFQLWTTLTVVCSLKRYSFSFGRKRKLLPFPLKVLISFFFHFICVYLWGIVLFVFLFSSIFVRRVISLEILSNLIQSSAKWQISFYQFSTLSIENAIHKIVGIIEIASSFLFSGGLPIFSMNWKHHQIYLIHKR